MEDDLKSELGGNFESLIVGLITPPTEYLAKQLNKAMKGFGTDTNTVIEILVTRSSGELKDLVAIYEKCMCDKFHIWLFYILGYLFKNYSILYFAVYDRPLVEHLCSETSGDFRKFITLVVTVSMHLFPTYLLDY